MRAVERNVDRPLDEQNIPQPADAEVRPQSCYRTGSPTALTCYLARREDKSDAEGTF